MGRFRYSLEMIERLFARGHARSPYIGCQSNREIEERLGINHVRPGRSANVRRTLAEQRMVRNG